MGESVDKKSMPMTFHVYFPDVDARYKRALAAGEPGVLGDDAARLLGTMNLKRVQQILQGAQPKSHAERELVALAGARGAR